MVGLQGARRGLLGRVACRGVKIIANNIRPGNVLEIEGRLLVVQKRQHVKPGKGGAFVQIESKDIRSSTKKNIRLRASEDVEFVQIENPEPYTLLYRDGKNLILMHETSFEQIELPDSTLSAVQHLFLQDGMVINLQTYENEPIAVELPKEMELTVTAEGDVMGGGDGKATNKVSFALLIVVL